MAQVDQAAADQGTLTNGMPYGTIGELKISRLIFGSNTPGAHSRDLIYVSAMGMLDFQVRENAALVKRYATRLKDRERDWSGNCARRKALAMPGGIDAPMPSRGPRNLTPT